MQSKKLTFIESVMLIAGAGIGTGIISIPYAIARIGVFGTLTALAVAYVVSVFTYLMLADLVRNSKESEDLIGSLNEHVFTGKGRRVLNVVFLVLLALLLLEFLVVYTLCAGNVLADLLGINGALAKILFYLAASSIVFVGVKGMGVGEKISVTLIGVVVIGLTVLSLFHRHGTIPLSFGRGSVVFAVYGLFMYSLSSTFAVIQVCNHIEKPEQTDVPAEGEAKRKPDRTGQAVVWGIALNGILTTVFSVAVILGSENVTEIATIGLSEGIGIPFVKVLCSLLVLGAMFTSFWSIGFAFSDVVFCRFKRSTQLSWLITTLPAALIAVLVPLSVLDYVQIGAGALSLIFLLVVFPAYLHAVKDPIQPLLLGKLSGKRGLIAFVVIGTVLMAVASLIPIS
ncbi:MAG: hypothetical protein IKP74_00765 [Clostridia bacterium]|nr:hypothetical protein [Clostridia bacterium]